MNVMDMRHFALKMCPFGGTPGGASGSKWRYISIEILKIEFNFQNPFRDLKMFIKDFWQIFDKNKMSIGKANLEHYFGNFLSCFKPTSKCY